MSQVDIAMFSTIIQTATGIGLVIYSFWLSSVFFLFSKTFFVAYQVGSKSSQVITLLFKKI